MTSRPLVLRALLLLGVGLLSSSAIGAEGEDGARLAWKYHCISCHGPNGISNSYRYPNLAGQNVAYLVGRLRYFRERLEPGNQMNAQAAPLSDEEIDKLAEYFNRPYL
jgi:cytochrome c553